MARRATAKPADSPVAIPLPTDWRTLCNWQVRLMLAKIPPADYESVAQAFEDHHKHRTSLDWRGEFKAWCDAELTRRSERAPVGFL